MVQTNPVLSQRRSAVEIVYEVLTACANGRVNKTAIMYKSSLNHEQLQRYLSRLGDHGLIEADLEGRFHLTPEGRKAFQQVEAVVRILTDF